MKHLGCLWSVFLWLAGAGQAAQDAAGAAQKAIRNKMPEPSLSSPVSLPGLDFQLTTEKKDKKGKAKIGLWVGDNVFFDAKFTAPLGSEDAETEPVSLDGLAKSSVLDVGFHYLAWRPRIDENEAKAILAEYGERHPRKKSEVLTYLDLKNEPDLQRRFLQAVSWGNAYFAALRAKIGRRDFSYVDSKLEEFKARKTDYAFEAAAGVLFPEAGYIGFSYEFQRYFEGGSSADLVLPYQNTPYLQIRKLAFGAPVQRNQNKLQLEYRKTMGVSGAINPKISYFFRTKVALIELPVYVFKGPEDGLNGGINLTWTSRGQSRFGLALFIGAGFGLWPD